MRKYKTWGKRSENCFFLYVTLLSRTKLSPPCDTYQFLPYNTEALQALCPIWMNLFSFYSMKGKNDISSPHDFFVLSHIFSLERKRYTFVDGFNFSVFWSWILYFWPNTWILDLTCFYSICMPRRNIFYFFEDVVRHWTVSIERKKPFLYHVKFTNFFLTEASQTNFCPLWMKLFYSILYERREWYQLLMCVTSIIITIIYYTMLLLYWI